MRTSIASGKIDCLVLDFSETDKTGVWRHPDLRAIMTNLDGAWRGEA